MRRRSSSIIHDESLRLTRLLDDLLDLSVLENGQVALCPVPTTLREVIDRAVTASGVPDALRIRRDPEAEAQPLVTDPDRLAQVFINLITNAAKYCNAAEPELRIAVRRGSAGLSVDFVDNGSGIPAASQGMIFEKFSRLGDTRAAGGAGLGLAICREIMANLGGAIAYLPGQGGAAFRVTLPVAEAAAA
jgi:signal transduction histidine kinase